MSIAEHFTPYYLLANCRPMLSQHYKRKPNWVIAMSLFAVGSKTAWKLCIEAEIDPEGTSVIKIKPEKSE